VACTTSTTWTSFSDHYFEGGFEDPFSDKGEYSTDEGEIEDDQLNNAASPSIER
jgi:general stress protein 26